MGSSTKPFKAVKTFICIRIKKFFPYQRLNLHFLLRKQRAKKVVSDSQGLVDFAIGLVVFVLNLPDGQVLFFGKFKLQKDCNQSC